MYLHMAFGRILLSYIFFPLKLFLNSVKMTLYFLKIQLLDIHHCHILTKLGGGRNCLRLRVTRNLIIISSWFPFSLLAPVFDLVHVIPYSAIIEIKPTKTLWMKCITITYRDKYQDSVTFTVISKNHDKFTSALKENLMQQNAAANNGFLLTRTCESLNSNIPARR